MERAEPCDLLVCIAWENFIIRHEKKGHKLVGVG